MEEKVKVEGKVREDLNAMVKSMGIKREDGKYGEKRICVVTLFNGVQIEFNDRDKLYYLLKSFKDCGEENYIKEKRLVERVKTEKVDDVDEIVDDGKTTYICVEYELADGTVYKMFPSDKFVARGMIDNYYKLFKRQQKQDNKKVN